jgi:hypothetical protein
MATGLAPLRFAKDLIRRSEGRARADHHRARPFPITLDELARAVEARSAGTAARTRTGQTRQIFGRPRRPGREAPPKHESRGSQSNELFS